MPTLTKVCPLGARYFSYFEERAVQADWTFLTTGLRSGGGDTKINVTYVGPASSSYVGFTPPSATRVIVSSFYVQFPVLPTGDHTFFQCNNVSGNATLVVRSSGNIRTAIGATNGTNVPINANQWYHIDARVTVSGGNTTIDWMLDGIAQTSQTVAQVDADLTTTRFGIVTSATLNAQAEYMDMVSSYTSGDYPLGPYAVYTSTVAAVGNHNFTSGDFQKTGAVSMTATEITSWQEIDELPPDNTNWVQQIVANATEYASYTFTDSTSGTAPDIVAFFADYQGAAGGAYLFELHLYDGTTVGPDVSAGLTKGGTTQNQIITYMNQSPSSTPWTRAAFDGTRARFGYSTDVTPAPQLNSMCLVQAVPTVAVGGASVLSAQHI